jgi:hypothetical protein
MTTCLACYDNRKVMSIDLMNSFKGQVYIHRNQGPIERDGGKS